MKGFFRGLLGALVACVGMVAQAADSITYFHNDLAGSPVAATNESGQLLWKESYRPYGERLTNSSAAQGNRVWFTSRRQDAETGLVYMGARYYDPVVGRFVSMDPKGFDDANIHSQNRYAYANNNPCTYVDPDGRAAIPLGRLVFTAAYEAGKLIGLPAIGSALGIGLANIILNENKDESGKTGEGGEGKAKGNRFPGRKLPRDEHGNPKPDPEAEGPHTQLGQKEGRNGKYDQAREFDVNGKPVKDIDFTDHGRPSTHPSPHQHQYNPNATGGTPRRGPTEPL